MNNLLDEYSNSNLKKMKQFYLIFSNEKNFAILSNKFNYSHFVEFIKI
jgi:hypothetical protein